MIAAIENLFVPVFIRNSKGKAHDKAILKEFKEPAWNYPVERFLNNKRKNLIPRLEHAWKNKTPVVLLATKMLEALKASKLEVPEEGIAMLKVAIKGEELSDKEVKAIVETLDGKVGRELHKALNSSVRSYEKRSFAAARKSATKVFEDKEAEEEAKEDAEWLIAKIDGKFKAFYAEVSDLTEKREMLELLALVDRKEKEFKGMESFDKVSRAIDGMKKDEGFKAELDALKAFEKLSAKHTKASAVGDKKKREKELERVRKSLNKLAEKHKGTLGAEKASALAAKK